MIQFIILLLCHLHFIHAKNLIHLNDLFSPKSNIGSASSRIGSKPLKVPFISKPVIRKVGTLPASYQAETLVGTVGIGTPPQNMTILFDTGSTVFWARSAGCLTPSCWGKPNYNALLSSTYKSLPRNKDNQVSLRYGDGTTVLCNVNQDTVTIAGIKIENQNLCEANFILSNDIALDGLIGIGAPKSVNGSAEVLKTMIDQNLIDEPKISFWYNVTDLPGGGNNFADGTGGEIIFGSIDSQRFTGSITNVPLTSNRKYWSVMMNGIKVGDGPNLVFTPSSTVIDTGTTLTYLPVALFNRINSEINARIVDDYYVLDCDRLPTLKPIIFDLGNLVTRLTPAQYTIRDAPTGLCVLTIQPVPEDVGIGSIIGALFLKQYYVIFDYGGEQIGFATPTYEKIKPKPSPTPSTGGKQADESKSNHGFKSNLDAFIFMTVLFALV
ncbi:hypothetical protein HDV02_003776 [Globomyces sp. JEL0801]|nr:hypothetical protein HDV02_003776 [Globomyces sp. JEL0801]